MGWEFVEKFTGDWLRPFSQLDDYGKLLEAGYAPDDGLNYLFSRLTDQLHPQPRFSTVAIREILEADAQTDAEFEQVMFLHEMDWDKTDWEGFEKYRSEVAEVLGLGLDEVTDVIQTFHALNGEKEVSWWKESFQGIYETEIDFAESIYGEIPNDLDPHIDWGSVVISLSEGDFTFIELDSRKVAVFKEY